MMTATMHILAWFPGHWEILLIILALLLLFGGRKLPDLARNLAKGIRTFRSEIGSTKKEIEDALNDEPDDTTGSDGDDDDEKPTPAEPADKKDKSTA